MFLACVLTIVIPKSALNSDQRQRRCKSMRMQISCSPVSFNRERWENQIKMNSNPHEPGALTGLDTGAPISSRLTLATLGPTRAWTRPWRTRPWRLKPECATPCHVLNMNNNTSQRNTVNQYITKTSSVFHDVFFLKSHDIISMWVFKFFMTFNRNIPACHDVSHHVSPSDHVLWPAQKHPNPVAFRTGKTHQNDWKNLSNRHWTFSQWFVALRKRHKSWRWNGHVVRRVNRIGSRFLPRKSVQLDEYQRSFYDILNENSIEMIVSLLACISYCQISSYYFRSLLTCPRGYASMGMACYATLPQS